MMMVQNFKKICLHNGAKIRAKNGICQVPYGQEQLYSQLPEGETGFTLFFLAHDFNRGVAAKNKYLTVLTVWKP